MKWTLTPGLFAFYLLAAGCSTEVAAPDKSADPSDDISAEGDSPLIGNCCKSDADCATKKSPRCIAGVCSAQPADGECWSDDDCDKGETCEGASTCPCGAQCLVASHPGKCVAADPCVGLDYCSCAADPACQAVTEPCFCPCGQYSCAGNCACFCGGGAYLGCQSL